MSGRLADLGWSWGSNLGQIGWILVRDEEVEKWRAATWDMAGSHWMQFSGLGSHLLVAGREKPRKIQLVAQSGGHDAADCNENLAEAKRLTAIPVKKTRNPARQLIAMWWTPAPSKSRVGF
jgi:hypothetical protein